ncbi:MAG: putative tRNA/rRNA methyltransferase [Phycisphaerae bacterium]|nr:putative tRNA/rRNA methyltransferase [Phycisphaerae bacterium]
MLSRIRIVLVETRGPGNIGAACRAMSNLGFDKLRLVAPQCDPHHEQAVAYAAHALPLLKSAIITTRIADALDGCIATFATTAREGLYRRQTNLAPPEAAAEILRLAAAGNVAIAFGPEWRGFSNPELLHFDRVITIPTDSAYPALNLAAAVAILCYEVRRTWLDQQRAAVADESQSPAGESPPPAGEPRPLADDQRKAAMFAHLFDSLERIGFFFGQNPDHLKYALRHLLGRVDLSINECDILIGMARQIRWYCEHAPRRAAEDGQRGADS